MKLVNLNEGESACIKIIYGDSDLSIHLMEMGLVKNTKIKGTFYDHKKTNVKKCTIKNHYRF